MVFACSIIGLTSALYSFKILFKSVLNLHIAGLSSNAFTNPITYIIISFLFLKLVAYTIHHFPHVDFHFIVSMFTDLMACILYCPFYCLTTTYVYVEHLLEWPIIVNKSRMKRSFYYHHIMLAKLH